MAGLSLREAPAHAPRQRGLARERRLPGLRGPAGREKQGSGSAVRRAVAGRSARTRRPLRCRADRACRAPALSDRADRQRRRPHARGGATPARELRQFVCGALLPMGQRGRSATAATPAERLRRRRLPGWMPSAASGRRRPTSCCGVPSGSRWRSTPPGRNRSMPRASTCCAPLPTAACASGVRVRSAAMPSGSTSTSGGC